jgi:hypothetical protein
MIVPREKEMSMPERAVEVSREASRGGFERESEEAS